MSNQQEIYVRFSRLIYEHSGLVFNDINISILDGRLRDQTKKYHIDLESYYNLVTKNPQKLQELLASVTTNLTKFFRNSSQYNTLQYYIIPKLIEHKKKHKVASRIRLWSAGCSTGEEVYSNAISLQEWLPPSFNFEVIGTDLNPHNIQSAEKGIYSLERIENIPSDWLNKYFIKSNHNNYTVTDSLKKKVSFKLHNLNDVLYENGFDIIFCRNVLIYFDEKARIHVVNKFYQALNSLGYLMIGHSESLFGLETSFNFIRTQWTSLYGKEIY